MVLTCRGTSCYQSESFLWVEFYIVGFEINQLTVILKLKAPTGEFKAHDIKKIIHIWTYYNCYSGYTVVNSRVVGLY